MISLTDYSCVFTRKISVVFTSFLQNCRRRLKKIYFLKCFTKNVFMCCILGFCELFDENFLYKLMVGSRIPAINPNPAIILIRILNTVALTCILVMTTAGLVYKYLIIIYICLSNNRK